MRTSFALALLCLICSSGCASWNGTIVSYGVGQPLPGITRADRILVEEPVVQDDDRGNDFLEVSATYVKSLQGNMAEAACASGAFKHCLSSRSREGRDYRIATKVVVHNFRNEKGGVGLMLGGAFLPPLIGMAWSFPVAFGTISISHNWSLISPDGEVLVKGSNSSGGSVFDFVQRGFSPINEDFQKFLRMASAAVVDREGAAISTSANEVRPVVKRSVDNTRGPMPVVAIFDIQDQSQFLQKSLVDQLTTYLTIRVTQTNAFEVVPRDQLRMRLGQEKSNTYKDCYDLSCQIELGKAIAAGKSLATQILRIGSVCVVTSSLFDLRTETASRAASVETGCSAEDLLKAMAIIAEQIKQ